MAKQVKTVTVIRNIYGGMTNEAMGLYNAEETNQWINDIYLAQGYKIINGGFMYSPNPTTQGGVGSHMFYWMMVKEAE